MRRLEFLMNRVRYETDNKDANGIGSAEIVSYFNDAQRYITSLIFKNNPDADLFKGVAIIPTTSDGVYDIPEDCFSSASISLVEAKWADTSNNDGFARIKPIQKSEAGYFFGYYTENDQVIITGDAPNSNYTHIRITYFKRLKTLDVRQGIVTAVTPGVSIAISPTPTDLFLLDDHASAVDAQGDQVVADIYFTNTSGSPLLTANTAGVTTSHYIVAGKNSANKSELPEECETYLVDYVKQRIYSRNNYEDANKQMYFTEQQRADIIAIFSKNKKDDDSLPLSDLEFLAF